MSKARKTSRPLTAQRKAFLKAVKVLRPYFDESGFLNPRSDSADYVAERLVELRDALRGDMNRISVSEFASAVCSAIYFLHSHQSIKDADEQAEQSVGGEVFEVAFNLGWAMGFDCGKHAESEKESSQ